MKKCPSSIQCCDSNRWHLEHESPPITTRPRLPSFNNLHHSFAVISVFVIYNKKVLQYGYPVFVFVENYICQPAQTFYWTEIINGSGNWEESCDNSKRNMTRLTLAFVCLGMEFFLKIMGHSRPLFLCFYLFNTQLTVRNVQYKFFLPMTRSELRTSGIVSNRSTKWVTTTAQTWSFLL